MAYKDICAAWYRRAQNLLAGSASLTSTKLDNYVEAQSMVTLTTLYQVLQTLWVGHPHKLRRADIKALQLAEASKAGLKTPHALISNDPAKADAFVDRLGDMECAVKPLIAFGVGDEQGHRLPLTTTLPKGHALDSVALASTIFRPYVHKADDIRCAVIQVIRYLENTASNSRLVKQYLKQRRNLATRMRRRRGAKASGILQ